RPCPIGIRSPAATSSSSPAAARTFRFCPSPLSSRMAAESAPSSSRLPAGGLLPLEQLRALLLDLPAFGDVNAGADVTGEAPVGREPRDAAVEQPTVLAVRSPEPVFQTELAPGGEGTEINLQTALVIVGVDALGPTQAQLLRHRAPGEIEPGLVE